MDIRAITPQLASYFFQLLGVILSAKADGSIDAVQAQARDLAARLAPELPDRPDGSKWTPEALETMAVEYYTAIAPLMKHL